MNEKIEQDFSSITCTNLNLTIFKQNVSKIQQQLEGPTITPQSYSSQLALAAMYESTDRN